MCVGSKAVFVNGFLGDVEKKHGMAVSPLCDRLSDSTAHIQAGMHPHTHTRTDTHALTHTHTHLKLARSIYT